MINFNEAEKKKKIEDFLLKDKFWSAEILSCMNANIFPHIDAFFYLKKRDIKELALLIKKMNPVPLFFNGNVDFCNKFLSLYVNDLPHIHIECVLDIKNCFDKYFDWRRSFNMKLMYFDNREFDIDANQAQRLDESDIASMVDLLKDYIDEQDIDLNNLQTGFYFGVKKDGKLVSMAGTHNIAADYKIATIGNVVTSRDYYGKGYAQASVKAVIAALREKCSDFIIKVEADNEAALRLYGKLGFVHYKDYFEGFGLRRK